MVKTTIKFIVRMLRGGGGGGGGGEWNNQIHML